jgi:hypothetical protein
MTESVGTARLMEGNGAFEISNGILGCEKLKGNRPFDKINKKWVQLVEILIKDDQKQHHRSTSRTTFGRMDAWA